MLHVLNGEATLDLIKQSNLKGRFLVWKDMLMEGPVTAPKHSSGKSAGAKTAGAKKAAGKAGVANGKANGKENGKAGGLDFNARAKFLKERFGINPAKYLSGMKAFSAAYGKAAAGRDEVVFWFEEDFFCQIHLIYLLAHLPEPLRRKGRASVICPEKPLGVRLPGAFPRLLAGRLPIEPALITLAAKVWKAYASDSPGGWETLLKWAQSGKGFEPWPLLKSGLRSHLGRLPSRNGKPNAMETAMLHALASGAQSFQHFERKVRSEPLVRPLGLGDLQVARYALDLAERKEAPLRIEGPDNDPKPGEPIRFAAWKLHLTAAGKALLEATGAGATLSASRHPIEKPARAG